MALPDVVWSNIIVQLRLPFGCHELACRGPYLERSELDSLAALACLCRTSSRLRILAERALYSGLPAADTRLRGRLISAIRQNPRLAGHVQAAELGDAYMTRDEFLALVRPPAAHEAQHPGSTSATHRSLADRIGTMRDLPDYSEEFADAWPAHIIGLVPNIKFLDITMSNIITILPSVFREAARVGGEHNESQGDSSTRSSLHSPTGNSSPITATRPSSAPLSQLEEIVVRRVGETKGALRIQLFEDLLLLPRLRKFHGQCVDLNTELSTRTSQPASSLTHVVIAHSLAEAAGILDLLRVCPFLRTLRIHWGDSTVGDAAPDWDEIGNSLREYGSNLEVLDLDCRDCLMYDMGECNGKIGSLRDLRRLRHLSLPQDVLLGNEDMLSGLDNLGDSDGDEGGGAKDNPHDELDSIVSLEPLLPESLESLHLYSCYEEEEWVRHCVQAVLRSRRLYNLSHIQLDGISELNLPFSETGWERKMSKAHLNIHRVRPPMGLE
ncbi:hypothetical protein PG990_008230 [Apiospora arundinis]